MTRCVWLQCILLSDSLRYQQGLEQRSEELRLKYTSDSEYNLLASATSSLYILCISYVLSLSAPSPSSCVVAAAVAPGQQGAVSRGCRDPTKPDYETGRCGNVGSGDAHGCGSQRGPDS